MTALPPNVLTHFILRERRVDKGEMMSLKMSENE